MKSKLKILINNSKYLQKNCLQIYSRKQEKDQKYIKYSIKGNMGESIL